MGLDYYRTISRMLHWEYTRILSPQKNKTRRSGLCLYWLGTEDSNLDMRSQSPVSYH